MGCPNTYGKSKFKVIQAQVLSAHWQGTSIVTKKGTFSSILNFWHVELQWYPTGGNETGVRAHASIASCNFSLMQTPNSPQIMHSHNLNHPHRPPTSHDVISGWVLIRICTAQPNQSQGITYFQAKHPPPPPPSSTSYGHTSNKKVAKVPSLKNILTFKEFSVVFLRQICS